MLALFDFVRKSFFYSAFETPFDSVFKAFFAILVNIPQD